MVVVGSDTGDGRRRVHLVRQQIEATVQSIGVTFKAPLEAELLVRFGAEAEPATALVQARLVVPAQLGNVQFEQILLGGAEHQQGILQGKTLHPFQRQAAQEGQIGAAIGGSAGSRVQRQAQSLQGQLVQHRSPLTQALPQVQIHQRAAQGDGRSLGPVQADLVDHQQRTVVLPGQPQAAHLQGQLLLAQQPVQPLLLPGRQPGGAEAQQGHQQGQHHSTRRQAQPGPA